jgi:polyisoprenoid-binding protein YceI
MSAQGQSDAAAPARERRAAALACRLEMQLPLVSLSSASFRQGHALYRIDEALGPIEFHLRQGGLFSLDGALSRFGCDLRLDRASPMDMQIDLSLDLTSVVLSRWEAQSWQPFMPWFDIAAHPTVRFRSSAVAPARADRYLVRGLLELGGITRLLALEATVINRRTDPITATEVAELLVTGSLPCSAFGMPSGQMFVSDLLALAVRARIELET